MFSLVVFLFLCVLVMSETVEKSTASSNLFSTTEVLGDSLAESIAAGQNLALTYCQHVFRWETWNCSRSSFNRRAQSPPTREAAYTKAIIAAGIVHVITKNCSRGELADCGCDAKLGLPSVATRILAYRLELQDEANKNGTKWSWGGCSDDPTHAEKIAQKFLDGLEKETNAAGYVGRHNFQVGREIVRESMVKKCRCHGVSGSCTLQTCWMQLISFGDISRKLKDRYKKSVRLTSETVQKYIFLGNSPRDTIEEKEIPNVRRSLVHLLHSPDYCLHNRSEGIPGTRGRTCKRNSNATSKLERNSCRHLCKKCGYSVKKITKQVTVKCNCVFVWCCEVKCDSCVETVDEHVCE